MQNRVLQVSWLNLLSITWNCRRAKDDFSSCHVRTCVRLDVQFRVRTSNFVWRITICWMSLLKDLECFERLYYSVSRFTWHLTLRSYWVCDIQSYLFATLYVKPHARAHVTCAKIIFGSPNEEGTKFIVFFLYKIWMSIYFKYTNTVQK